MPAAHVSQLAKFYEQIQEAGAEVIVILGDTLVKAETYVDALKLPFPVLSDPEREVYRVMSWKNIFCLSNALPPSW